MASCALGAKERPDGQGRHVAPLPWPASELRVRGLLLIVREHARPLCPVPHLGQCIREDDRSAACAGCGWALALVDRVEKAALPGDWFCRVERYLGCER
eukprot:3197309-Alexandrium_andersonii.AAC.1